MPLPRGLPIVDHHCHLSTRGEGVRAAERFRAAGGTHLFLATQNYDGAPPLTLEAYERQYELTGSIASQVRARVSVAVYPVIAPYPVDLVAAVPRLGAEAALNLHRAALDLAGRWVREKKAVALGEVGRPHFPVSEEVATVAEAALRYAFAVARDSDCPLVVHSADLSDSEFRLLGELARSEGVRSHRVVKHFARRRVTVEESAGVVPSYLAQRDLVAEVVSDRGPWFLETDFLDDPTRPGAVLDLATVPRRAAALLAAGKVTSEGLFVPFVESVEKVYGWRPELGSGGPK